MADIYGNIEKLVHKKDEDFYITMLNKDVTACKFDLAKKLEVIEKTIDVTNQFKRVLVKRFGEGKPSYYVQRLGLEIRYINEKDTFTYNFIGQYDTKKKFITLNMYVINKINEFIRERRLTDLVKVDYVSEVVLAHELFHHMQELYPDTYIEQKNFEQKILGLFKIKTKLVVLEEIGAVSFSKTLSNLEFNPLIYNKIYGLSKQK